MSWCQPEAISCSAGPTHRRAMSLCPQMLLALISMQIDVSSCVPSSISYQASPPHPPTSISMCSDVSCLDLELKLAPARMSHQLNDESSFPVNLTESFRHEMAPLTPQSPTGTFLRVYDSVPPPNMTTRHGLLPQNHSGQALPTPKPTHHTTMCLHPLRLVQALEDSRLRIDTSRCGSDPLSYPTPYGTAPLRPLRLVQALETRSKDSMDIPSNGQ